MKKFGLIILLAAIISQGFCSQANATGQEEKKTGTTISSDENTKVSIGKDFVKIEEGDSSVNIRVGNRGLTILETLEGKSKVHFEKFDESDMESFDQDKSDDSRTRKRNRFKGHWSGVEFGFNNYLTSDRSNVMPDDINYMSLHSSKSHNFNINFSQLSLGITRRIGFVTGLGFNWNNYRFDGENNITKGTNGVITGTGVFTPLKKSKFATSYLTLPFMLEFQLPIDNNSINLAAGPIGALKLSSHSKMVTEDGQKIKSNSDFSLNILRYGATARVGYGNFQLYGTYYMTPMFKSGKGPGGYDLYPFELGVAFTFND